MRTTNLKSLVIWAFCSGGGGKIAFTMAEILLSLTIIGVVAAITLPSLTGNINERTWNTQRKALYARFSQAMALMPSLAGYGTINDNTDTTAETFITNGLSKVLKINNICDNEHLEDCGLPAKINPQGAGSAIEFPLDLYSLNANFSGYDWGANLSYSLYNTAAAGFETANGESIAAFYNPDCIAIKSFFHEHGAVDCIAKKMCVNFIYDLNGSKGPNTIGKDMGWITVFNSIDPIVVAPIPSTSNIRMRATLDEVSDRCRKVDDETRLPNAYEMSSIMFNNKFINIDSEDITDFWTSSRDEQDLSKNITVRLGQFALNRVARDQEHAIRCIKR